LTEGLGSCLGGRHQCVGFAYGWHLRRRAYLMAICPFGPMTTHGETGPARTQPPSRPRPQQHQGSRPFRGPSRRPRPIPMWASTHIGPIDGPAPFVGTPHHEDWYTHRSHTTHPFQSRVFADKFEWGSQVHPTRPINRILDSSLPISRAVPHRSSTTGSPIHRPACPSGPKHVHPT
jgi:hypothetical protein